jgi:hypothetical protein
MVTLCAVVVLQKSANGFAFAPPFHTNQMGQSSTLLHATPTQQQQLTDRRACLSLLAGIISTPFVAPSMAVAEDEDLSMPEESEVAARTVSTIQ